MSDDPSLVQVLRSGTRADYRSLARLSFGYALTGLLPRRLDGWAVGRLLRTSLGVPEACVRRTERRMRSVLGAHLPDADFAELAARYCAMTREEEWVRWRALHGAPVPVETSVEGREHVEAGLAEGKGVILWGFSFCETLVFKIAMHAAGLPFVQLSTVAHGVPQPHTELGMRWLGPAFSSAENHFLEDRVSIPADQSLGYVRTLNKHLAANRCVYIAGESRARKGNVTAPVLGGEVELATGAPGFAWKSGARMLPAWVVRDGLLRYRAIVGAPIEPSREDGKEAFVERAVKEFGGRLSEAVLANPPDWGWFGYHTVSELVGSDA